MLKIYWDSFKTYLLTDRKLSANNIERIKSSFTILCRYFDEKSLQFNRDNFNSFIETLLSKNYSKSYINTFIKYAKHLDRFLKKEELTDYTYFKETERLVDYLTPEEITKLALCKIKYRKFKKFRNERMSCLIFFLGCVGSRISETLSLKKSDFLSSPEPMVYFRSETTKGNKPRYCIIPKWLFYKIMALPDEKGVIFGFEETVINDDLKLRAKKCGITKNVYAHLFRHSSINNKLTAGMPLEIVTNYHGHSSTSTTYKYYIHIQQKQMAEYLYMYDPFFRQGLTYEALCKKIKDTLAKMIDKRLCDFSIKEVEGKLTIELDAR